MPATTYSSYFESREPADEPLVRQALEMAEKARSDGDFPAGAVLAWPGGQMSDRDTTGTDGDPTAHAAVNVIRKMARTHRRLRLAEAVLYVSAEPCVMCAAAAAAAGIREIVYAGSDADHGAFTSGKHADTVETLGIATKGGLLREECLKAGPANRGA